MRKMKKATVFFTMSGVLLISSNTVMAQASPFAHVPIYINKVEQSKAKSNLMLMIDDSGSMREIVPGSGGLNRMTVAKNVARQLVTDPNNLKNFRFGIAHLFMDINGLNAFYPGLYTPASSTTAQQVNCSTNRRCADRIIMTHIADANNVGDTHVTEMTRAINSLQQNYATPSYSALSEVYKVMPNYMQYRCQKNYVIYVTDGQPYEQNTATVVSGPGRYTAGVNYLRPLVTTLDAAKTDYKVGGNDAEGQSWDDPAWPAQTIKTSVIAFSLNIPAMENLTKEGGGFYLQANNANQLSEALSTLLERLAKSPNPVPVSPAMSGMEVPGKLDTLSARIFTDVSNWSSELRFLQFESTTNSEEKDGSGKLKFSSPKYGTEASTRTTIISTPSNGVQSLDKGRMSTVLTNASFGFDSSKAANYWSTKFIPWLDGWSGTTDAATGFRDRGTGESRYLGDILGGNMLNVGEQSSFTLNSGKNTKISEYILLNSNDGMFKIYKRTGNTTNPYELKLNYIAGAAKRESGIRIIDSLKDRADSNYGLKSTNPHLYLGDGGMNQLTSPRGQNVLLSTLGRGGRGVFAVNLDGKKETDLTEQVGLSKSGVANWKDSVPLWDSSAKISSSSNYTPITMGYTVSRPALSLFAMTRKSDGTAKLTSAEGADVRMAAFMANGYEDDSWRRPTLFIIDIIGATMVQDRDDDQSSARSYDGVGYNAVGSTIREIQIPVTLNGLNVGTKTGLSSPTVVDLDGDEIADIAYAGDRNGNVYRFDFRKDTGDWKAGLLFKGRDTRPVSIAPKIYRADDSNQIVVLFGTGSEIYESDASLSDTDSAKPENLQEMYGIVDDIDVAPENMVPVERTDLQEQTITTTLTSEGNLYRETSSNDVSTKKGWYMTLTPRERVVREIVVRNGTLYVNTTIIKPTETAPAGVICFASEAQGSGWSMHLKAATGAMPKAGDDNVHKKLDSGTGKKVPVSGLFIDKMALPDVSFAESHATNPYTSVAYTHDFYGVRLSTGRALFGLTNSVTGVPLPSSGKQLNVGPGCNPNNGGSKSFLLLPNSNDSGDQENASMKGLEIDENCPTDKGVRRLSWRMMH